MSYLGSEKYDTPYYDPSRGDAFISLQLMKTMTILKVFSPGNCEILITSWMGIKACITNFVISSYSKIFGEK